MDRPNIILIVADTMRRDAIGIYNKNVSTPNIDALARDSMVYNNAISPSPWTVPSHASIFTGKYAIEHELHESRDLKSNNMTEMMNSVKYETIAEYLKSRGYTTLGFSSNPFIAPNTGFDRGFDYFYLDSQIKDKNLKRLYFEPVLGKELVDKIGYKSSALSIIKLLASNHKLTKLPRLVTYYMKIKKEENNILHGYGSSTLADILVNSIFNYPTFLFFNLMDMHDPYLKKEKNKFYIKHVLDLFDIKELNDNYISTAISEYYRRSTNIDKFLGILIDYLKKNNLYEDTIIVFTSDHGQSFKEKHNIKFYGHGTFLYDELIRVPLIIKYPNKDAHIGSVDTYISLTNIFPLLKKYVTGSAQFNNLEPVFSESYGIQDDYSTLFQKYNTKFINNKEIISKIENIDIKRKALFYKNYKLTLNCKGEIEEFEKDFYPTKFEYNKEIETLLNELDIFIGNENFHITQ